MGKAEKTPAGQKAVFEKFSISAGDWSNLFMRVKAARDALGRFEKVSEPIPSHLLADVEIIKANREKITAAQSGKAVGEK
jgi:hypothetical protein